MMSACAKEGDDERGQGFDGAVRCVQVASGSEAHRDWPVPEQDPADTHWRPGHTVCIALYLRHKPECCFHEASKRGAMGACQQVRQCVCVYICVCVCVMTLQGH